MVCSVDLVDLDLLAAVPVFERLVEALVWGETLHSLILCSVSLCDVFCSALSVGNTNFLIPKRALDRVPKFWPSTNFLHLHKHAAALEMFSMFLHRSCMALHNDLR